MWKTVSTMMPRANRMLLGRRNRGMNTATALLVGAAIGIATWEMMRRNNPIGNLRGRQDGELADAAKEALEAVK